MLLREISHILHFLFIVNVGQLANVSIADILELFLNYIIVLSLFGQYVLSTVYFRGFQVVEIKFS